MTFVKYLIGILFCFIVLLTKAQDTIYLKDSNKIIAKILELNKREIVFKKYDNIEGPIYRINFYKVKKVGLYNIDNQDSIDAKNQEIQAETIVNNNDSTTKKNRIRKNFLGGNLLTMYSSQFNFFYMRNFKEKFYVRIPLYISTQNKNKFMHRIIDLEIRSGADFFYKPTPHLPIYFGVSANVGMLQNDYDFYEVYNDPYRNIRTYQPNVYKNRKSYYWGFSTTGGYFFQLSKEISVDSFLGIGFINYTNGYIKVEKTDYRNIYKIYRSPSVYAGLNVAYRF
jgi:hypothetical protein